MTMAAICRLRHLAENEFLKLKRRRGTAAWYAKIYVVICRSCTDSAYSSLGGDFSLIYCQQYLEKIAASYYGKLLFIAYFRNDNADAICI